MGFSRGASSSIFVSFLAGFGVSSIVECLPVVHGGISRNSSKVKTRGLQQSQPTERQRKFAQYLLLRTHLSDPRGRLVDQGGTRMAPQGL